MPHWLAEGLFPRRSASAKPAYSIVIPPPNVTGVLTLGPRAEQHDPGHPRPPRAHDWARKCSGCPAPITPASPRRPWWRRRCARRRDKAPRRSRPRGVRRRRSGSGRRSTAASSSSSSRSSAARATGRANASRWTPEYSRCVQQVFVDLYKKGLIYRGKRMVNWCPASLTALSRRGSDHEAAERLALLFQAYEVVEEPGHVSRPSPPRARKRFPATPPWR